MIETIVPIGYLHLINAVLILSLMFLLVFIDMKKHNRVNFEAVIFYTIVGAFFTSILVYSYKTSIPIACFILAIIALGTSILFALYYIAKYMEKCAKLLLLKLKNKEEEENRN